MQIIFRLIAMLEGGSYILLLMALPFKYLLEKEQYVKALGMPHGVLFILYIVMVLVIRKQMKWNIKSLIIIILASIIPFGTFYVDHRYLR